MSKEKVEVVLSLDFSRINAVLFSCNFVRKEANSEKVQAKSVLGVSLL